VLPFDAGNCDTGVMGDVVQKPERAAEPPEEEDPKSELDEFDDFLIELDSFGNDTPAWDDGPGSNASTRYPGLNGHPLQASEPVDPAAELQKLHDKRNKEVFNEALDRKQQVDLLIDCLTTHLAFGAYLSLSAEPNPQKTVEGCMTVDPWGECLLLIWPLS
jgi:hypothetical protein